LDWKQDKKRQSILLPFHMLNLFDLLRMTHLSDLAFILFVRLSWGQVAEPENVCSITVFPLRFQGYMSISSVYLYILVYTTRLKLIIDAFVVCTHLKHAFF